MPWKLVAAAGLFAGGAIAGIVLSVAGVVNTGGDTTNNIDNSGGGTVIVNTPPVNAATICGWQDTEVSRVVDRFSGDEFYVAKYEGANVRYDLTWRDGSDIAVEALTSDGFSAWPELMSDEFLECVGAKDVAQVEVVH